MKATEIIKHLEAIIKEYGDLYLIYSADDEGNYFDMVHFAPMPCEYHDDGTIKGSTDVENFVPNAICIN